MKLKFGENYWYNNILYSHYCYVSIFVLIHRKHSTWPEVPDFWLVRLANQPCLDFHKKYIVLHFDHLNIDCKYKFLFFILFTKCISQTTNGILSLRFILLYIFRYFILQSILSQKHYNWCIFFFCYKILSRFLFFY